MGPCGCELKLIDYKKISITNQNLLKNLIYNYIHTKKQHKKKKQKKRNNDNNDDDEEMLKELLLTSNITFKTFHNSILCRKCLSEMIRVSSDIIEVNYNTHNNHHSDQQQQQQQQGHQNSQQQVQ